MTNVPAQSLTMMNDPVVAAYAAAWAHRLLGDSQLRTDRQRIERMFMTAFSRPPVEAEIEQIQDYMATPAAAAVAERDAPSVWTDLCHAVFTMKEFIYVP